MAGELGRPHGRDEVVAALVKAASRLFAEKGPAAVSLREVAGEAGVNLGLIHRHIGTKEDLLAAVLADRADMGDVDVDAVRDDEALADLVVRRMVASTTYDRILVRAALDGFDVQRLQAGSHPIVELAAAIQGQRRAGSDAAVRVALLTAAVLGWQAIAPTVLQILRANDLPEDEVARRLRPAVLGLLASDGSG